MTQDRLLSSVNGQTFDNELDFITNFYRTDMDHNNVKVQLYTHQTVMIHTKEKVLEYLHDLSPSMHLMLSEVITLVKLILVMSATNAISELSVFPVFCWLKIYLQTIV